MQLGKELATGFVSDEAQDAPDAETGPPDTPDAKAPQEPAATSEPAAAPEPAAAG